MKKVIISNVSDLRDKMSVLSRNVVKPAAIDGLCTIYCSKDQLLICAAGIGSFGYVMTQTEDKWDSPLYLVSQKYLADMATLLPVNQKAVFKFEDQGIITVESEDETVKFQLRAGHTKNALPKLCKDEVVSSFELDSSMIDAIQRKVLPSADTDGNFNSVGLVAKKGEGISLYATNRYTIAQLHTKIIAEKDIAITTPVAAWTLTAKKLDDESLHYDVTKKFTFVTGAGYRFAFNNLEFKLPPFEAALNKVITDTVVNINKDELTSALKRMSLLANVGKEPNPIELHFSKNEITFFTKSETLGTVKAKIPHNNPAMEGKRIAFILNTLEKGIDASENIVKLKVSINATKFDLSAVKFDTSECSQMMISPTRIKGGFTDLAD